jgi:hypothetical protein
VGALVVFESMYGNTREVAEAIAEGISSRLCVEVVEVGLAPAELGPELGLLVVGAPTHALGLSREETRASAAEQADREVISAGRGLREWLEVVRLDGPTVAAAFDTHTDKRWVPGSASGAARRRLRRLGCTVTAPAESFYVSGLEGPLVAGEVERAREWGRRLAERAPEEPGRASGDEPVGTRP